jgi:hypothetical protein
MMVCKETIAHVLDIITDISHAMCNTILNYDLCVDMLFHEMSHTISIMNKLTSVNTY